MSFHVIAEIRFKAKVVEHPQSRYDYIKLDSPPWTLVGDAYVKDEGLVRYTLSKTSEDDFFLVIEQIDLFGLQQGKWTDKRYPERKALIHSALQEIEDTLGAKIVVTEIKREVL